MAINNNCCQTLNGVSADCSPNLSGLYNRIWYTCRNETTSPFTEDADTQTLDIATGTTWQTMDFARNTAHLDIAAVNDVEGRPLYFTPTLTVILPKQDPVKRMEVMALAYSDLYVIARDRNGYYSVLGYEFPVVCSVNTATGETTEDGANAYTLTFTDEQSVLPHYLSDDAIAILTGTATA